MTLSPHRSVAVIFLRLLSRMAVCGALILFPVFFHQTPAFAANEKTVEPIPRKHPSLETSLAGRRYSATRAFSRTIPENDAIFVAEAVARSDAMQSVVRYLITLPEVRIAASTTPSPIKSPNLLALAHATVKTSLLLVSKSRKDSTVTVTISLEDNGGSPPLELRVREALVHPDRLDLYEKTVLREQALIEAFDALSPVLAKRGKTAGNLSGTRPGASPEEAIQDIVKELKALAIFKDQLPSRNGLWKDPATIRDTMRQALLLAPKSALCHNAKGDALLQLGRSREAMDEQTLAVRADPLFSRAYHSRGAAALALGHLSSAVADFSEAIRLSPNTGAYHRARGMANHLLGETVAMCRDLQAACSFGHCEELQWATANHLCPAKQ